MEAGKGLRRIIEVESHGRVEQGLIDKVLGVLVETYECLGPPLAVPVKLRFLEKSEEGVVFFASHDASLGKSVISVYADKISSLPSEVLVGGIRRQAAHSILHGSPEFYMVRIPEELKKTQADYNLPESLVTQILYGISMTAKEYGVTKFLISGGFIEDQKAYVKYILEPVAEEVEAWKIAKTNPLGRILYLVMTIRDMSCALPLAKNLDEEETKAYIISKMKHLPPKYRSKIKKILKKISNSFSDDISENIKLLSEAIIKEFIKAELNAVQ